MNIRSPKHSKPDIVAEACAWFIEFRALDASSSDRSRFYEWLRRSPEHVEAYLEIAEGWAELPTSDPQGRIDMSAIIKRARESQDENVVVLSPSPAMPHHRRHPTVRAWAVSFASVALVVGLGTWFVLYRADTYSTGIGEQRTVRLADGSIIELNALSMIRVRLSQNERDIDLTEGQALFHVAKDHARPFIVRSDGTTIRAVGTQFDVYQKHEGTVVTVLEGRVTVTALTTAALALDPRMPTPAPIFLVAGEQVTVPTKESVQAEIKPKHTDVAVATAWVQKRLIFEETPLAEAAAEFNRYSTRPLVITDPELRSMGISGVYSSTDPDSLLGFLRAQPNIQVTDNGKEIRVGFRKKK